jgi:hypothetical protein
MNSYELILYVADQDRSREFYSTVLEKKPSLDVPGMTEFDLSKGLKLGLMPEKGIVKILGDKTPHPESGNGIPRCELYILCGDPQQKYELAIQAGATAVSAVEDRDWGATVGYVSDPDGHILAFAREHKKSNASTETLIQKAKEKSSATADEHRMTKLWEELDADTAARLSAYFGNEDEAGFCYYQKDDLNWTVLTTHQLFGKKGGEFCCFPLFEIEQIEPEQSEGISEIRVKTAFENQPFDTEPGNSILQDALELFRASAEKPE